MASHEAEAEAATAGAGAMSLRTTGTGGAWAATAGWAEADPSLFEQPEARNAARPMAAVTNVVKRSVFIGPSISGWNLSPPGGLRKWGYHPMRAGTRPVPARPHWGVNPLFCPPGGRKKKGVSPPRAAPRGVSASQPGGMGPGRTPVEMFDPRIPPAN